MAAKEIGILFIRQHGDSVVSVIYDVENNCAGCLQKVLAEGFVPVLRIHSDDAGWFGFDYVTDAPTELRAIALKIGQQRAPDFVKQYWSKSADV
jgi:hypothetical protein